MTQPADATISEARSPAFFLRGQLLHGGLLFLLAVVAYALAGRVDFDPVNEPLGTGSDGQPVFLRDVWPTQAEVADVVGRTVRREMFESSYASVYEGDAAWRALDVPAVRAYYGDQFDETNTSNTDDVAESYWWIHQQPKSAWSNEVEIRPYTEEWTY